MNSTVIDNNLILKIKMVSAKISENDDGQEELSE